MVWHRHGSGLLGCYVEMCVLAGVVVILSVTGNGVAKGYRTGRASVVQALFPRVGNHNITRDTSYLASYC